MVFDPSAKRVIELAFEEARRLGHAYVGTEHLLLGLIAEGKSIGAKVLVAAGVDLERARGEVEALTGRGQPDMPGPLHVTTEKLLPFAPRLKPIFELATAEALKLKSTRIGTGHVLLALARDRESLAGRALTKLGVDEDALRRELDALARADGEFPPDT
jgi:ATP-dependent Clp protease ATP-binding subunit ClpC